MLNNVNKIIFLSISYIFSIYFPNFAFVNYTIIQVLLVEWSNI